MLIQRVNREDREKVFVQVKNVEGATITTGHPVALVGASCTAFDGVAIANAAADYPNFYGIAVQDIPNNEYGQVQISGFVNSVLLSAYGSSVTITAGDPLVPSAVGMASAAPTYAASGFKFVQVVAMDTAALSAAGGYARGWIRRL